MPFDSSVLRLILEPQPINTPILSEVVTKSESEDFVVEELPAYQPCGDGEHLYLWIEKRGVSGSELLSRISRALGIRAGDIGVAGLKDRHAITRQYVSVHRSCEPRLSQIESADVQVLSVQAHQNKLRTGHLRGNRFVVTLRSAGEPFSMESESRVAQQLERLSTEGFASYFGPQRFGHLGSTLSDGIELLAGRLSRKRWPFHHQRFMTRLVISAVQSAVFNLVADQRVRSKTLSVPLSGDVVIRKNGTRPYLFDANAAANQADPAAEPETQEPSFIQVFPAGPMPGPKMLASTGVPHEIEQQALRQLELTGEEFTRFSKLSSGTRRSMIEFPENISTCLTSEGYLQLCFDLRSGTYATTLLREVAGSIFDAAGKGDSGQSNDELFESELEFNL